jgi:hypothetical protein
MSLGRGQSIGYDGERMAYRFTMMNDTGAVHFEISNAALSDLGKRWINRGSLDCDQVFQEHRDLIENIAVKLYGTRSHVHFGPIQIFAKHLGFRRGLPTDV